MKTNDLSKIIGKWPGEIDDGFEAAIDEHRHGKKNHWNDPNEPPDADMEVLVRVESDEYPIEIAFFDGKWRLAHPLWYFTFDGKWKLEKNITKNIIGWMHIHDVRRILDES